MTPLEKQLGEALQKASDHLDYCGYGDAWESECARDSGLETQINTALEGYNKEKDGE